VFPIILGVLDYTEGVNPQTAEAKSNCDNHRIAESAGKIAEVNALKEIVLVAFQEPESLSLAPAMAKCKIGDSFSQILVRDG
jgi:hypothetical protein